MTAVLSADRVNELVANDPYLTALGLRAEEQSGAVVVLVLPALERHLGIPEPGVVHGGVIAAFLEATASLHLRATAESAARTVEFTSDFLRPVPLAPTYAQAVVLRHGRRFASVRVEAWQADRDRLVAVGVGRFLVDAGL